MATEIVGNEARAAGQVVPERPEKTRTKTAWAPFARRPTHPEGPAAGGALRLGAERSEAAPVVFERENWEGRQR